MFSKIFHTASYRRKLPVPFFEVLDQEYAALNGVPVSNFSWDFAENHLIEPVDGLLEKIRPLLADEDRPQLPASCPKAELVRWLNKVLHTPSCLYDDPAFPKAGLSLELVAMARLDLDASELTRRNRLLLEEAFPEHLQKIQDLHLSAIYRRIHDGEGSTALCFSGGGIRSATFALGITQGLAKRGIMTHFDYLSTVSGGGYIGSWLSSWIHYAGDAEKVFASLKAGRAVSPTEPEPHQLSHLRRYSNYLTPKLGAFSADTWVLVATYLRNLLLNWLVFAPILLALFALPRFHLSILNLTPPPKVIGLGFAGGFALIAWALAYAVMNRPEVRADLEKHGGGWYGRRDQKSFLIWCLLPFCVAATSITLAWAWAHNGFSPPSTNPALHWFLDTICGPSCDVPPKLLPYCLLGAGLHFGGWLTAEFFLQRWRSQKWKALRWEFVLALFTGAAGGAFLWVATRLTAHCSGSPVYMALYTCFAAPVFLILFLIAATIFIGAASELTSDEDREWWARMGAWMLIVISMWSLFSALVLFGPLSLLALPKLLGALGGLSGLFTLFVGHSASTASGKGKSGDDDRLEKIISQATSLAAPLSLAALAVGLSLATGWLMFTATKRMDLLASDIGDFSDLNLFDHFNKYITLVPWWLTTGFLAACIVVGWGLSLLININKFSLHAIYRNRLVRAYLGASNPKRHPNPFTGFDPADNLPLQELRDPKNSALPQRPLHLINLALNLVTGDNLAWQQRKAETFTASTLHCGNFRLGYRFTKHYALGWNSVYRQKTGLSLGTAVAVSGAAASPNQGYHSSTMVALLMTLFNVRLGWWLGNPGAMGHKTFHDSAPRSPVRHFVKEALGLTDSTSQYVYLSDGGHFENLGLYEMVLRRVRLIVVSDAGCDPECSLEDLGNAIRKIRIDLGVKIDMTRFDIYARDDEAGQKLGRYCALGEIDYGTADEGGRTGLLVYLKPALLGSEPRDIYNYARESLEFPHESTSDQWFSESQFESYRALGQRVIDWIYASQSVSTPTFTARNEVLENFVHQAYTAAETPRPSCADGFLGRKSPAVEAVTTTGNSLRSSSNPAPGAPVSDPAGA